MRSFFCSFFIVSSNMGAALHGSWFGQITLHSWRQVINLPCSRQSGLHGQSSPAQGRQTSTVSYLTCIVQSERPPAMSPEVPEWPIKSPCVQFEGLYDCVPLGPNPFYYSLLRKMKLKKEKNGKEKKRFEEDMSKRPS